MTANGLSDELKANCVDAVSAAAAVEEDEGTFEACMDTIAAVSEDTLWTVVHAAVDEGSWWSLEAQDWPQCLPHRACADKHLPLFPRAPTCTPTAPQAR